QLSVGVRVRDRPERRNECHLVPSPSAHGPPSSPLSSRSQRSPPPAQARTLLRSPPPPGPRPSAVMPLSTATRSKAIQPPAAAPTPPRNSPPPIGNCPAAPKSVSPICATARPSG